MRYRIVIERKDDRRQGWIAVAVITDLEARIGRRVRYRLRVRKMPL